MSNQTGNNKWHRIAPSVLISAAINAALIIALSVVVTSPLNKNIEYPVNYENNKINDNQKINQITKVKKISKPVNKKQNKIVNKKKNNNTKVVKTKQKKNNVVTKSEKKVINTSKKIITTKTLTPTPLKAENTDKKNNPLTNPAAIAKNNPGKIKDISLPKNDNTGGGERNNNLTNDTPGNNRPSNNGNTGLPGRIGPGNIPGRPGPNGNGNDIPGGGDPTFGSPLTPSFGNPGGGNGPGNGDGTEPGNGHGDGNKGHGNGIGPGRYRGGDGDGPGTNGWGGDGNGEPRNLAMTGTSEKPGDKSKNSSTGNPGTKLNPDSGTPGYSRKARAIKLSAPEYPSVARRRGQEGDVYVRVDVNEEGKPVGKPVVVISSGVYQLDQSAIEYVQDSDFIQYVPSVKGGKPVKDSVVVQVTFKLSGMDKI